jgi:hypothetical protein
MNRFIRTLEISLVAFALYGCMRKPSHVAAKSIVPTPAVRRVVCDGAPQLQGYANRARSLGNELYPKILALLGAEAGANAPLQFDVVVGPLKSRNIGEARIPKTRGDSILYLNSHYFDNSVNAHWMAADPAHFDMALAHEIAHIAQQSPKAPSYWVEGLCDYARYKLGYTNGWSAPQCSAAYPHYTSGYWCTGAFLLFLDSRYGSNTVRTLSRALRSDSYSDSLFLTGTGHTLEDLWSQFQKTSAYGPRAVASKELQDALGYVNGQPPRDIDARYKNYVLRQKGGPITFEALNFILSLSKQGQLPGFLKSERAHLYKGESGSLSFQIPKEADPNAHPLVRTIFCYKMDDQSTYVYKLARSSHHSPWKVQRACRMKNERIVEEYSLNQVSN